VPVSVSVPESFPIPIPFPTLSDSGSDGVQRQVQETADSGRKLRQKTATAIGGSERYLRRHGHLRIVHGVW